MEIEVSVVLPSLNVAAYIRECLDSVIAQTLPKIEMICVDGGSTDGTVEILHEYARADARIRVLNLGVKSYGKQVNEGIRRAEGKYIAIVETDDFIGPEMYEKLYGLAERFNLDYVKADFMAFEELRAGGRVWKSLKTFPSEPELYGRVIVPRDYAGTFARDYNIWRGIYRKEFLVRQGVLLNETPGAAYQDIGFIQQTLCLAERAMYVDDSFYCYRGNRKGASTCRASAIQYVYQEFDRLLDKGVFPASMDRRLWGRLYHKLAASYLMEYEKVARMERYNADSMYLSEYDNWFREKINYAIKEGLLVPSDLGQPRWFELELLLKSSKSFADYRCIKDRMERIPLERLLGRIGGRRAVIFGCGKYGKELCALLDKQEMEIAAFCDNKEILWGTECCGIEIMSPESCNRKYADAAYLIGIKRGAEGVKKQLEGLGIPEGRIITGLS